MTRAGPPPIERGLTARLFWPSVALTLGLHALFAAGTLPALANWALTAPLYYFLIICGHDAIHRCAAEGRLGNDLVGWVAAVMFAIPYPVVRRAHQTHHARYGREAEIEEFATRPGPTLPLRMVFGNLCYYAIFPECTRLEKTLAILNPLLILGLALAWPRQVLLGWALPMQTGVGYIMLTTIWMPHGTYRDWVDRNAAWVTGFHNDHHALPGYPFHQIALTAVRRFSSHRPSSVATDGPPLPTAIPTSIPGMGVPA